MKYIITEEQFNTINQSVKTSKIEKTIIKFLDDQLTPFDGWDSPKGYQMVLDENGGELFIITTLFTDTGRDDANMWYSLCDNENLSNSIPEGHCPLIVIPSSSYVALDGYFGDMWKEIFIKWFKEHTGLDVVQIDKE